MITQTFELIAESALNTLDAYYDACHVCGERATDLYEYQGQVTRADGTVDDDVYAVCPSCILSGKLLHTGGSEYLSTIRRYLDSTIPTADEREQLYAELAEKYQRTPDIPLFMQKTDRPLCCRDITVFTGHPTEATLQEVSGYTYWEGGVREKDPLYDFQQYGPPESLHDVAAFQCRYCGQPYFTFQFT